MNIEGVDLSETDGDELDTADRWILTLFEDTARTMNRCLSEYNLMEASSTIYEFFWHEFCDWYIEISKVGLYSKNERERSHAARMLIRILEGSLRLLHPIMPFITEEIWQRLPGPKMPKSIMVCRYPSYRKANVHRESVERIAVLKELVYNIRNIRGELNVPPELKARVLVKTTAGLVADVIEEQNEAILFLARLSHIVCGSNVEKPPESAAAVGSGYEVYLPLRGLIDIEKEKQRLEKERVRLEAEISRASNKLKKRDFLTKAPREVVERERDRLDSHTAAHDRVVGILDSLQ
jgi:valyl-tRNA synthetase